MWSTFRRKPAFESLMRLLKLLNRNRRWSITMNELRQKSCVLDLEIDKLTMNDVLDKVHEAIISRSPLSIGVVNAAKLVNMKGDEELHRDVASSELVLADGMSVVWASKLLGDPLPERVSGIDLMHAMMQRGDEHGYRFYLFGAREDISAEVERKMAESYPNAVVAGRRNGYFKAEDEEEIVRDIASSNSDILLVAITSPIKERFMARWRKDLNIAVIHGVGGSFDVMAGKVERAPKWMQDSGLEWFYRLKQEPSRLIGRYARTNSLFLAYLLRDWLSKVVGRNR